MSYWIHAACARHPDRIAIEGLERSLTYAELRDAAVARAASEELTRASRVAIALPPDEDWVIALHACLVAGAAVVPIDLRLSDAEQAARRAAVHAEPGTGGDVEVAVMHTSGTTAAPKPVVLSAGNFLASALGSAVALGLDQNERWLCPMPLTHVGGLSIPIRSAIYGTTAIVHGRFDTEAVLSELMDPSRRITLVSLVPTMLARLLDAGLRRPPTLRWALLGGGPIAPALLTRASRAGVPVAPTYGMTEACSQIATFGWPLAGVDLRIAGDDGEVLVRGPIVSAGAAAEDGWLHTGDLGRLDDRDRLEVVGRKADTIVSGGENVAPAEVEAILLEHPAVAEAAVHPRPDAEWGEAVVATVVLRNGAAVPAEELRSYCAARLAAFKVPKAVSFTDRLPRTASGKLLRREL
ncbi:MAG: AMP-binding protein [Solirubrobacterales bacterium]|nr:AMP-binding protein [Solirubrobacterales bacterium]